MGETFGPLLNGGFALVTGDAVGILVDKLMKFVDSRMQLRDVITPLGLADNGEVITNLFGLFVHVGLISIGCELMSRAVPWMFSEPAGYTLFILSLWSASPGLREHIDGFNQFILEGSRTVEKRQDAQE